MGPSYQTCVNARNVAQKLEFNRRRLDLVLTHHAEIAPLPPPKPTCSSTDDELPQNGRGSLPAIRTHWPNRIIYYRATVSRMARIGNRSTLQIAVRLSLRG